MKNFVVILLLFVGFGVQAQQGYGSQYRSNGRQGNSIAQAPTGQPTEPEKPDANLISAERAIMYQELLGVDVFTKEVLKNYLNDYYTMALDVGFDKEMLAEDKRKAIEEGKKKLEKSLGDILNEEQVARVMAEEATGAESKKYKKDKKKEKRRKRKTDNK